MKNNKYFVAVVLLFIFYFNTFAIITPNPIISRGKPAYGSNGDASSLVDNVFGYGVFTVTNGSWIAIEVGSGPTEVYIAWNNSAYSYSDIIASESSCSQGMSLMVDYTIQVSSNSTNGADGDWTIVETITGNTVSNRGHLVPFEGSSWVKLDISSGGGSLDEVEVFDMSGGGTDSWFFPGTSITANAFKGSVPEQNFADVVAENHSGFTPIMIRGGIPCMNSTSLANDIDLYLENAGNVKYWAIEMGTNDAWGGSNYNVETFRANLQVVIEKCKENGIEPIIARMIGTNEEAAGWQVHPDYLIAIDELTEQNSLFAGPDFYTWFSTHPEDLASDGVHPSASGAASMQRLWAEQMASLYTGSSIPVEGITITPSVLSIMESYSTTLIANVLPNNATNKAIVWSSEDTEVVTVDGYGNIQAISTGITNVVATTVDGGYSASCKVTVLPDTVLDDFTLNIKIIGVGDVELSPAGGTYPEDSEVTLTAITSNGSEFLGWSGDATGTASSVTIIMDSDKDVTANFTSPFLPCESHTAIDLPLVQNGAGEYCWMTSGTIEAINSWNLDLLEVNGVDLTNSYVSNLPAKIDGFYYIHYISSVDWGHVEIAGSGETTDYELIVIQSTGGTIAPSGGVYPVGTEVTVTATPDSGYKFSGWTGDLSGASNPSSLTMDADKTISAGFVPAGTVEYSLSVIVQGEGVVVPSEGSFVSGTVVTLSATPAEGYVFTGWSGDASGTSSQIDVTMDGDKSITALFEPEGGTPCENPVSVTVPFTQDGSGEYCWATTDEIAYVNSWNMDQVEINGVDYTNVWSDGLPAKIDGSYYIYCRSLYSWSHLEVAGPKSAPWNDATEPEVSVYPNPFNKNLTILLDKPEMVQGLSIIDQAGKTIYSFPQSEIRGQIELNTDFDPGIYLLRVVANNSVEIRRIINK